MIAQDYNMTLEEALEKTKHRPDFQKKLKHSIDLLRKAEKLALKYDAEDGFYLAFSAGKDSQAMFHVAQMGVVKFKAHMNFTSVDPPQVIIFKRKQYPCVVEHPPRASIFDLAVEKGILPSMRIRWCCAELKESAGAGKVTLIGIRKSESARRAKRHEVEVSNKQFSGNLEQFFKWQQEKIAKKEEKLMRKMKREGKKVNEDEFSLHQDNEVRCINGKDSILVSPIFEWSESDVWYFLNDVLGVPHCELYDQGYTRIGCILCPMSQYKHKLREMKDFPHVKRGWIRAIKQIRAGGYQKSNVSPTQATGQQPITPQQRSKVRKPVQQGTMEQPVYPPTMGAGRNPTQGKEPRVPTEKHQPVRGLMEERCQTTNGNGTTGGSFHTHTATGAPMGMEGQATARAPQHLCNDRLDCQSRSQGLVYGTEQPTQGYGRVF